MICIHRLSCLIERARPLLLVKLLQFEQRFLDLNVLLMLNGFLLRLLDLSQSLLLFNILLNLFVVDLAIPFVMSLLRIVNRISNDVLISFIQPQRCVVLNARVASCTLLTRVKLVLCTIHLRLCSLWGNDCTGRLCSIEPLSFHFLVDFTFQVIQFHKAARFTHLSFVSASDSFREQASFVCGLLRPFPCLFPSTKDTLTDLTNARLRPLFLCFGFSQYLLNLCVFTILDSHFSVCLALCFFHESLEQFLCC